MNLRISVSLMVVSFGHWDVIRAVSHIVSILGLCSCNS
jgi:hypothetical protein